MPSAIPRPCPQRVRPIRGRRGIPTPPVRCIALFSLVVHAINKSCTPTTPTLSLAVASRYTSVPLTVAPAAGCSHLHHGRCRISRGRRRRGTGAIGPQVRRAGIRHAPEVGGHGCRHTGLGRWTPCLEREIARRRVAIDGRVLRQQRAACIARDLAHIVMHERRVGRLIIGQANEQEGTFLVGQQIVDDGKSRPIAPGIPDTRGVGVVAIRYGMMNRIVGDEARSLRSKCRRRC